MPVMIIAGFLPMFFAAYAYREFNKVVPGLRHVVHLDDEGLRPVRRVAGRLGGHHRHDHRAVQPRRRRGPVLLPVPRRPGRLGLDQRPVGEQADQRRSPAWSSWRSRPGWPTAASPPPSGSRSCWCSFQLVVLLVFAIVAFAKHETAGVGIAFSSTGSVPAGLGLSAFIAGLSGSIFAFWGWDTALTVNEESKDSDKTPGRAALLCVLSILLTYLLVAIAAPDVRRPRGQRDSAWGTRRSPTTSSAPSPSRCSGNPLTWCCSSPCWPPRPRA